MKQLRCLSQNENNFKYAIDNFLKIYLETQVTLW